MCHVISFRFFEDTDTDLMGGHGKCKGNLDPRMNFLCHIQSNHPKYNIYIQPLGPVHVSNTKYQ